MERPASHPMVHEAAAIPAAGRGGRAGGGGDSRSGTWRHVVVSYPVHGISGFHDHLVCHAIVKRVFCDLRRRGSPPYRLAFHTLTEEQAKQSVLFPLHGSTPDEIGCVVAPAESDVDAGRRALGAYVTFEETVRASGISDVIAAPLAFEIFGERHDPPLEDLFDGLGGS